MLHLFNYWPLVIAAALTCFLTAAIVANAEAEESAFPAGLTLMQAPPGATLITIPLAVVEAPGSQSPGYLSQRSSRPLDQLATVPTEIANAYAGKEVSVYEIAALPGGMRFLVALNEDKDIKFLNRNENVMWFARIYRIAGGEDSKPEVLREGYQAAGNDVTVPAEFAVPPIGTTKVKTLRTEVGYNINGMQSGHPQVYGGRGAGLQVVGSQMSAEGKLTLTITVPEEMKVTPGTQVMLRFEPLKPGLPERTAAAKVADFLTLGAARFVVTTLADDFSSATLAIVSGSLEETLKQQLQLGEEMPAFSQVELVSRKTVTREVAMDKARSASGVVFVFGDLSPGSGSGPNGPRFGPPGANATLPLPAWDIAEQVGVELRPKPLVILVTRQIGLDFLYGDLRNKTPDYLILTDYTDAMRTAFRQPQSASGPYYQPYMAGPGREPSLRQLFNLPENLVSIAAFESAGKVVYVKADAASSFLPSLGEARTALRNRAGGAK